MYADFKALLIKPNEKIEKKTSEIHSHHLMSYGFLVKASEEVSIELFDKLLT